MKTMNRMLTIPLTQLDRNFAEQIANQYQQIPQKKAQIRDNILAVCAVKNYLRVLAIPTDLSKNYSFNPAFQLVENVADLYLPDIGRLECRTVKYNEQICYIPAETWSDRIGYIAVELDDNYQEAKLLGFIDKVTTEKLPIAYLKPVDTLLETIAEIELGANIVLETWERLKIWVNQSLDLGWQTFDQVFNPPQLQFVEQIPSNYRIRNKSLKGVLELIETIKNPSSEKSRQDAISLLGEWG
ncbi:MAG TPA: DUF1822 family protein, partial [Allocoleopsis sp.]